MSKKPQPLTVQMPFGELLKVLIVTKGYTKEAFAAKIGRTAKHVDRLFASDRKLRLGDLAEAFHHLGWEPRFETAKIRKVK